MILLYPELNCSPCSSHGRRWASGAVNPPKGCTKRRKSNAIILTGSGLVIMSSSANGGIHNLKKVGLPRTRIQNFVLRICGLTYNNRLGPEFPSLGNGLVTVVLSNNSFRSAKLSSIENQVAN
ncbi:hypothetical protein MLD38_036399 [Melastoma candidum]|nr:hypothetical protein MLD38_036399 [Melastoma candidum]